MTALQVAINRDHFVSASPGMHAFNRMEERAEADAEAGRPPASDCERYTRVYENASRIAACVRGEVLLVVGEDRDENGEPTLTLMDGDDDVLTSVALPVLRERIARGQRLETTLGEDISRVVLLLH